MWAVAYQSLIESALAPLSGRWIRPPDRCAELEAIAHMARLVRLALPVARLGHSSFSHQFAQARTIRELLSAPGRFESLWRGLDWSRFHEGIPKVLEHEHYSIRCAHEILTTVSRLRSIDWRRMFCC